MVHVYNAPVFGLLPVKLTFQNAGDVTLLWGFYCGLWWNSPLHFTFLSYRVTSVKYIFTQRKLQSMHMLIHSKSYLSNDFIHELWRIPSLWFFWNWIPRFTSVGSKHLISKYYVTMQCNTSVYIKIKLKYIYFMKYYMKLI